MYNTLLAIGWLAVYITQLQCNTVHNKALQLHKCNEQLSNHKIYLLSYYVGDHTNTKLDHTHSL